MELEDQHWFPTFLRNQQTAFIGFVVGTFNIYKPLLPHLKTLLSTTADNTWTDCCSGSAGPVLFLQQKINFNGGILLTDKFPNIFFVNDTDKNIVCSTIPLDILQDKIPNKGLVTMFNAFHHFNKIERKAILEKLMADQRPFLIAEILQPTILDAFKILITATVGQILLAPFVQPFSLKRLFFTYLIPINIVTVLWDGIISVIKSIPFSMFEEMAESVAGKGFQAKAIRHKTVLATITFIVGTPIELENKN